MRQAEPTSTAPPPAADAKGVLAYVQSLPTWAMVLGAVVLLVLVGGAVYWWRKRRASGLVESEAPSTPLSTIWSRFLGELPIEARFLPVIIVIGRPRAGKTHLVQSQLDWEGLDRQLFPSSTSDPRLQCYVGRDALVQEIGWPLLKEKGAEVERQLLDLWQPLFSERSPTVVLVVDAAHPGSPDEMRELSGYVRGKMNLLAKIRRSPPSIRLCLSHMDELSGYRPLSAAIGEGRHSMSLALEANVSEQQLARAFSPLEAWLPQVLTASKPAEFKQGVQLFAQQIPSLSRVMTPLLRELAAPVYLSRSLELRELSLSGLALIDGVGAPLAVDARGTAQAVNQWTRRHMIAAGALGGGAILTATGFLYWHHSTIEDAQTAVTQYNRVAEDKKKVVRYERVGSEKVIEAERDAAKKLYAVQAQNGWLFFTGTYKAEKDQAYDEFLKTTRDFYINARFDSKERSETLLRALGLARATPGNDLGMMIRRDPASWARSLRLQESVVTDYVAFSDKMYDIPIDVPLPADHSSVLALRSFDPWVNYLNGLQKDYNKGSITRERLNELQAETTVLLNVIAEAASWEEMQRIAEALQHESESDWPEVEPLVEGGDVKSWLIENRAELEALLKMIKSTSIGTGSAAQTNLMGLLSALAAPSTLKLSEAKYDLTVQQNKYSLTSQGWANVIIQSQSSLLVDGFIASKSNGTYAFFANERIYPDTGLAAVTGKGASSAIKGIFTRAAFDAEVAPALEAYDQKIAALPLSLNDREKLDQFVTAQVSDYARAYGGALSSYYSSFQLQSNSAAVFRNILTELSLPTSFLATFLAMVADNANLELKNAAHFQPFAEQLKTFKPIVALMTKADGQYPKLAKYAEMLAPLGALPTSISQTPGSPLADRVSPLGQAAISILRSDKDSVQLAVQPWLAAEGIRGNYATPFLLPVQLAYSYGISEVQEAIALAWHNEVFPDISPMLSKFPFNQKADAEVDPGDLTASFVPEKGRFWQGVTPVIRPVCIQTGAQWKPIAGPYGTAKLPRDALGIINGASRMGQILWDKDGKSQPIAVAFRPEPLPNVPVDQAVPTLAVLRTGTTTSLAFNQKASWETIELQWDDQGDASIELQLGSPETKRKLVRTIDSSGGAWSFYRLLAKAETTKAGLAIWRFAVAPNEPVVPVSYAIRGAPWTPFQLLAQGE